MTKENLPPELLQDMLRKGIDVDLTLAILNRANRGDFRQYSKVIPAGVPAIDGVNVIDLRATESTKTIYRFEAHRAMRNLEHFDLIEVLEFLTARGEIRGISSGRNNEELLFSAHALISLGTHLLDRCAWGVFNGGSATSYCDQKKNQSIDCSLFATISPLFSKLASAYREMPKGLTPAYINPDGSFGASFLELKMRARLIAAARYQRALSSIVREPFMPLFQMTNQGNHETLMRAYEKMAESPLLAPLAERLGLRSADWLSGIQPMIAAFSHSSAGEPTTIFDCAYGKEHSALSLPGGHGQSFIALKDTFKRLRKQGIRFAMLSNVDNLGAFPDPLELAILAISGKPAGFDFAFKTPIDVKGGILVTTADGRKNIVDIGPAIELREVARMEARGESILFNCATGIFDLDWLVSNIESIPKMLPTRFSDQNKDAGLYSQAEQVTWEVVSLLPDFAAFAVEKKRRFVAAKMLVEMLLASGFGLNDWGTPYALKLTAKLLHEGQSWLLSNIYGMRLEEGRWVPNHAF